MKTVHNYIDVHKMKPVEMPVFSIISDDETVVTEIRPEYICYFNIDKCIVSINTNTFIYLGNSDWDKDKEATYTITYSQIFKDPKTNDNVLLEYKYNDMVHSSYDTYGNASTHEITYGYFFTKKEIYDKENENR